MAAQGDLLDPREVLEAAEEMFRKTVAREHGIDYSWEYIYLAFGGCLRSGNHDSDAIYYLALQLGFYLGKR
jgi:hypothetical protein